MNYERMWQGLKDSLSKALFDDEGDIDESFFFGLILTFIVMQKIENNEKKLEKEVDKEAKNPFEGMTITIKNLKGVDK